MKKEKKKKKKTHLNPRRISFQTGRANHCATTAAKTQKHRSFEEVLRKLSVSFINRRSASLIKSHGTLELRIGSALCHTCLSQQKIKCVVIKEIHYFMFAEILLFDLHLIYFDGQVLYMDVLV